MWLYPLKSNDNIKFSKKVIVQFKPMSSKYLVQTKVGKDKNNKVQSGSKNCSKITFVLELGVSGRIYNQSYWDNELWGWLVDRESTKASKWLAEVCAIPRISSVHTQIPLGADWIPICWDPCSCLVLSHDSGSIPFSCSARIWPPLSK